ncbi:MAG TPA: multidrug effflux MFS transporter [Pantanalinema sp.]
MRSSSTLSIPARTAGRGLVPLLGALTAIGPMSIDMYLPSLPTIARELGASTASVQLTLALFFVGLALGQLIYGPLSDRVGRKGPLISGLVLYVAASAGCAIAPNITALIAFRMLQALGGCAALVISRAMVRDLYPPREAAQVFSLMTLVMGVAPIVAPLAGGYLMAALGWRAVFGAQVAFGLTLLALAALALSETRDAERRRAEPAASLSLDYRVLLSDRRFLGFALSGGAIQAGMFAYISGSPFVFIELFQVPAEAFGWIFGANALGLIGASQVNGLMLRTRAPERILRLTILMPALFGLSLAALVSTKIGGFWGVALPLFGYLAALGFVFPNVTAAALSEHGKRAGLAAAVMGALQFCLAALAGGLVGRLHDATALPMAGVVGGCGVLGLILYLSLAARPSAGGR